MAKIIILDVNSEKIKKLVYAWGGPKAVGEKIHRSASTISNIYGQGKISEHIAYAIEAAYGVPYEAYKLEKTEPEPQVIMSLPETENDTKAILCLLREICNNQLSIYKRLNHLTGVGCRMQDSITEIEEKVKKL